MLKTLNPCPVVELSFREFHLGLFPRQQFPILRRLVGAEYSNTLGIYQNQTERQSIYNLRDLGCLAILFNGAVLGHP